MCYDRRVTKLLLLQRIIQNKSTNLLLVDYLSYFPGDLLNLIRKAGRILAMLFGTVEYFEREIENYLISPSSKAFEENPLSIIYSQLKYEILYDFVCDEQIRLECLNNLRQAKELMTQRTVSC